MKLTLYQITVEGPYKNFDGKGKISSRQVYRDHPTQEEQEAFRKVCCESSDPGMSFYDIDGKHPDTRVRINELQIAEKTSELITYHEGIEQNLMVLSAIAGKLDDDGVRDLGDRLDLFVNGYLSRRVNDIADGIREHNEKMNKRSRLGPDGKSE